MPTFLEKQPPEQSFGLRFKDLKLTTFGLGSALVDRNDLWADPRFDRVENITTNGYGKWHE